MAKNVLKESGSAGLEANAESLDHYFPDQHLWFVSFTHPDLISIVFGDEKTTANDAGIIGRNARADDRNNPHPIVLRDFQKHTHEFKA